MRPPDQLWFYDPPETAVPEPLIRPICDRINQSGWLWTIESCEGHGPENPRGDHGWGDDKPFIRFGCQTEHVGRLVRLLRRAQETNHNAVFTMYAGVCSVDGWTDIITYAEGIHATVAERRILFKEVAALATLE